MILVTSSGCVDSRRAVDHGLDPCALSLAVIAAFNGSEVRALNRMNIGVLRVQQRLYLSSLLGWAQSRHQSAEYLSTYRAVILCAASTFRTGGLARLFVPLTAQ